MTFKAAFEIPITVHSVFLLIASNTLANTVQVTPSGIGTTEARLVIALRDDADVNTDTAFSLAKTSIQMVWNAAFGVVALGMAFRISGTCGLLCGETVSL